MRFPRIPIPKRLNKSIDWVQDHPLATALWTAWAAATITVIWFTALRVPALFGVSGFVLGALHARAWKAVYIEDLREERARLRTEVAGHRAEVVPPVDTSADQLTRRLPRIPEGDQRV